LDVILKINFFIKSEFIFNVVVVEVGDIVVVVVGIDVVDGCCCWIINELL
jgi:hypothetical protein